MAEIEEARTSALLDEVAEAFKSHIGATEEDITILTLWVAYTHVWEQFYISPRLFLWSATPGSGKTSVLRMLKVLCPKTRNWGNATQATIFRGIEQFRPVLLLDETDKYLVRDEGLVNILNEGHTKDGTVVRMEQNAEKEFEIKEFQVWSPVAYAAKNKKPPADLMERSLKISMVKAFPGQIVAPFSMTEHRKELEILKKRLSTRAAQQKWRTVGKTHPQRPDFLIGRDWDNWMPLFSIASLGGREWIARAEKAARSLILKDRGEVDLVQRILYDLREVFDHYGWDKAHSDAIVQKLRDNEEWPWENWPKGNGLTPRDLAVILKPYGITPSRGSFRWSGTKARGYTREQFEEPWSRYGIGGVEAPEGK